ncbi:hypothetical protein IEQ34_001417 [Dendrobium chrysotoxum]|uniref:Uncharacterized protein n=1 Tax=Dendrobium chrysotoxum TaxID=161865 RepID=A0AAV7H7R0_DENCH|nr:hypothetical protein IEQ34_001417 [Dendrobium chrysotoxum]
MKVDVGVTASSNIEGCKDDTHLLVTSNDIITLNLMRDSIFEIAHPRGYAKVCIYTLQRVNGLVDYNPSILHEKNEEQKPKEQRPKASENKPVMTE